jgi:hypothetical protein
MAIGLVNLLTRKGRKVKNWRLREFVNLLTVPADERRSHERTPCFRQLTIYSDDETGPTPAVMRDISEAGVGLVHDVPLTPGEYTLRIPIGDASVVSARVNILWCRAAIKHFYMSGGPFVEVFIEDPVKLLS